LFAFFVRAHAAFPGFVFGETFLFVALYAIVNPAWTHNSSCCPAVKRMVVRLCFFLAGFARLLACSPKKAGGERLMVICGQTILDCLRIFSANEVRRPALMLLLLPGERSSPLW